MILTSEQIFAGIRDNRIRIKPFLQPLMRSHGYLYRLSEAISEPMVWFGTEKYVQRKIGKKGFVVKPGKVYLGATMEVIGSDYFVPSVNGVVELGNLGLFVHITADLGHIGTSHQWTLELSAVQPVRVYAGMVVGEVTFWQIEGLELLRNNHYKDQLDSYACFSMPKPGIVKKLR